MDIISININESDKYLFAELLENYPECCTLVLEREFLGNNELMQFVSELIPTIIPSLAVIIAALISKDKKSIKGNSKHKNSLIITINDEEIKINCNETKNEIEIRLRSFQNNHSKEEKMDE